MVFPAALFVFPDIKFMNTATEDEGDMAVCGDENVFKLSSVGTDKIIVAQRSGGLLLLSSSSKYFRFAAVFPASSFCDPPISNALGTLDEFFGDGFLGYFLELLILLSPSSREEEEEENSFIFVIPDDFCKIITAD